MWANRVTYFCQPCHEIKLAFFVRLLRIINQSFGIIRLPLFSFTTVQRALHHYLFLVPRLNLVWKTNYLQKMLKHVEYESAEQISFNRKLIDAQKPFNLCHSSFVSFVWVNPNFIIQPVSALKVTLAILFHFTLPSICGHFLENGRFRWAAAFRQIPWDPSSKR